MTFASDFEKLTGYPPFPWQERLYQDFFANGDIPRACAIPTGLGKTSVIAVWLIAIANKASIPRRLIYVVNRRTVVDQTTDEVEKYQRAIDKAPELQHLKSVFGLLPISTLRGQFADNGEWCEDPSRPAVICGTVDMIGSRLLFSGYGIGRAKRPLHAGFLGQDALLIHDEAHLEPAFQSLIETIEHEQSENEPIVPWPKFRVMELTATSKTARPFQLDDKDYADATVTQRITSAKNLQLHKLVDGKKPQKEIAERALHFKGSGKAILIFASGVEAVLEIAATLDKARLSVKTLTGTMRGKERDGLIADATFVRFMPKPAENATTGTVYLVCTSAGEVGVNISADHLICDLSTFDCMAQRLGRVNRFGNVTDCEVHIYFPTTWDDKNPLTVPRQKSLELLRQLNGNASPKALSELPPEDRSAAFAPEPTILPATDMLFDAWSLTTINGRLPGRPAVEPYLHGLSEQDLPETLFAWREEVHSLSHDQIDNATRAELLVKYSLLPAELLREPAYRAVKHLEAIATRHPNHHAWLVDEFGDVERVERLDFFLIKDNKKMIDGKTVLLDPLSGGLNKDGMLDGSSEAIVEDVSGTDDRCRAVNDEVVPPGLHEVYRVDLSSRDDEEEDSKIWRWFARRNTGELQAKNPVSLQVHVSDVETRLDKIIENLTLEESMRRCLRLAAQYHDHGKRRLMFQTMLGNRDAPNLWWAKSGRRSTTRLEEKFRHEFGSMHELPTSHEIGITEDERDLVMHLIAAHHGRARPHFPLDEVFDPDSSPDADAALAQSVPQRFGRLQHKFGRWGLAYLESLLRAADWAASANPSAYVEDET